MNEQELAAELARAREAIEDLRRRLDSIESRTTHLPRTMLLDDSFLKRAFAVLGHYFIASMIIVIPFYLVIFLVAIAVGLS
ncbi:MAG: hypothetical protein ACE5G0_12875 [Rhodothermales bacterium]